MASTSLAPQFKSLMEISTRTLDVSDFFTEMHSGKIMPKFLTAVLRNLKSGEQALQDQDLEITSFNLDKLRIYSNRVRRVPLNRSYPRGYLRNKPQWDAHDKIIGMLNNQGLSPNKRIQVLIDEKVITVKSKKEKTQSLPDITILSEPEIREIKESTKGTVPFDAGAGERRQYNLKPIDWSTAEQRSFLDPQEGFLDPEKIKAG